MDIRPIIIQWAWFAVLFIAGSLYVNLRLKDKVIQWNNPTKEQQKKIKTFRILFLLLFIMFIIIALIPLFSLLFPEGSVNIYPFAMNLSAGPASDEVILTHFLRILPYTILMGFLFFNFNKKYKESKK